MIKNKLYNDLGKEKYNTLRFYDTPTLPRTNIESKLQKKLDSILKGKIRQSFVEAGNNTIYIDKADILESIKSLKKEGFDMCVDISALQKENRDESEVIEIYYILVNLDNTTGALKRLKIKVELVGEHKIDSVSSVFKMANWAEREAYDMYGVIFDNHPNLQRILMPNDWIGHPLKKSYPLKGDENASWYEIDKIFGKEYREQVGAEQRDSARIDEKDTFNFSKIGYEVANGEESSEEAKSHKYQEDKKPFLIKKFQYLKTLSKRK